MEDSFLLFRKKDSEMDPNIELYLKFEGDHGSSVFKDSSNYNKSIQTVGSPRIDTTIVKRGSGSGYFQTQASTLSSLIAANGVVGGLGDRDFCVELWALWQAVGAYDSLFQIGGGTSSQYSGIILARNGVFAANVAGTNWGMFLQPAMAITNTGNFDHFALVRRSGTFRLFYNGLKQGNDVTPGYIPNAVNPSRVMIGNQSTTGAFGGYIDEFKLTVNDYKYWDDFNPESTLT